MDDPWDRLREAVEGAVDLPVEDADAYLARELGDDAALLVEAREVLDAGRRADGFLERSQPAQTPRKSGFEEGARLGPFEIRSLLGRGGMGTVFVAEQADPKRTVALKVLSGAFLAPKARERFGYEIQALASLRHRGIAQIYEAGVHTIDDGPIAREIPWFAMEYVEDAASVLAHADRMRLDTPARLRLFLEVCEAVHHGHQKGIVHRDLKPDNILVNADGHSKVIDFGVARITDVEQQLTTLRKGIGEIVGTLPYMAPEQVAGKENGSDVRADVYALGVVLYQLLLGELPIQVDRTDFVTSARRICESAPKRPSVLDKRLSGDLEAILLKTLEKDPARRYPSAEALGSDITRFLERRPIEARPPSVGYQLRLFTRRHLPTVIAAVAIVLISIGAAIVSAHYAVRSGDAELRALGQRDEARRQHARAAKMFETLLDESFAATLELAPAIHELAGGAQAVQRLMTSIRAQLRTLDSISEDDPRVRLLLAETLLRVGDMQGNPSFPNLGDTEAAGKSYREAIIIAKELRASKPESWKPRTVEVRALRKLAETLPFDGSKNDEKKALFEQALAMAEVLAEELPRNVGVVSAVPVLFSALAQLAIQEKDAEAALRHANAQIEACAAIAKWAPDPAVVLRVSATGYDHRGYALRLLGRHEEALASFDRAIELIEPSAMREDAPYEERRRFTSFLSTRAGTASSAGRYEEAEGGHQRAIEMLLVLRQADPEDRRTYMALQMSYVTLARVAEQQVGSAEGDAQTQREHAKRAIGYYREARQILGDSESRRAIGLRRHINERIAELQKDHP